MKFYLLLREWLSFIKYKQDILKNKDLIFTLDPSNSGFITVSSISKLVTPHFQETLFEILGFNGKNQMSHQEFLEKLSLPKKNLQQDHKKALSSLNFFKEKDLFDIEYNNYLQKFKEIKTMTHQQMSARNFGRDKDITDNFKQNTTKLMNVFNNHQYSTRNNQFLSKNNYDNFFWTEKKKYTPSKLNGESVKKDHLIEKPFFSASKEPSKSFHENLKIDNLLEKFKDTFFDKKIKKHEYSIKKYDPKQQTEPASNNIKTYSNNQKTDLPNEIPINIESPKEEPKTKEEQNLSVQSIERKEKFIENNEKIVETNQTQNQVPLDPNPRTSIETGQVKSSNLLKVPENLRDQRKSSSLIYESLILTLEDIYKKLKEKTLFYQKSIVFLMWSISEDNEDLKSYEIFFKKVLLDIFGIESFAIYSQNTMKTIYNEHSQFYERLKLESLLMDSFSIGCAEDSLEKEGLFVQKLGDSHEEVMIFYKIGNINEDNIIYQYFKLVEKYKFIGFKDHLVKFTLLIESMLLKKQEKVEIREIMKTFLSLIEYFIMNFKVLFLENLKKLISRTFNLEM